MGGVDDREQLVNNDGNQMDATIEFVNNSVSTLRLHLLVLLFACMVARFLLIF